MKSYRFLPIVVFIFFKLSLALSENLPRQEKEDCLVKIPSEICSLFSTNQINDLLLVEAAELTYIRPHSVVMPSSFPGSDPSLYSTAKLVYENMFAGKYSKLSPFLTETAKTTYHCDDKNLQLREQAFKQSHEKTDNIINIIVNEKFKFGDEGYFIIETRYGNSSDPNPISVRSDFSIHHWKKTGKNDWKFEPLGDLVN